MNTSAYFDLFAALTPELFIVGTALLVHGSSFVFVRQPLW